MSEARTTWGKIAIGLRSSQYDPIFFWSWTRLISAGTEASDRILYPAFRIPHSIAANFLLAQFLDSDCDSILFVDDDHDIPVDALAGLRNTPTEFDGVMAITPTRRAPFGPLVLRDNAAQNGYVGVRGASGVVEVDAIGLGFTLFSRSIIERVIADRGTKEPFGFQSFGEDGQFCRDVKRIGGRLAVNCDVAIGHNTAVSLWWDPSAKKTEMRFASHGFGASVKETVEMEGE